MYNTTQTETVFAILNSIQSYLNDNDLNDKLDNKEGKLILSLEYLLDHDRPNHMCALPESVLSSPMELIDTISFILADLFLFDLDVKIASFKMKYDTCIIEYPESYGGMYYENKEEYPEVWLLMDKPSIIDNKWENVLPIFIQNISDVFETAKLRLDKK
jgi:hypothetical protein